MPEVQNTSGILLKGDVDMYQNMAYIAVYIFGILTGILLTMIAYIAYKILRKGD